MLVLLPALVLALVFSQSFWLSFFGIPLRLDGEVFSLRFSPDMSLIAVSERNFTGTNFKAIPYGMARTSVWDVRSRTRLYALPVEPQGSVIWFSPDGGSFLVHKGADTRLKHFETRSGRLLHTFAARSTISDAKFMNGGQQIIAVSTPTMIWDAASGALHRTIDTPDVMSIVGGVLSNDGKTIAVSYLPKDGSTATKCQIWDVASGHKRWEKTLDFASEPKLSPDGHRVAFETAQKHVTNTNTTIRIFDTNTGQQLSSISPLGRSTPFNVSFSPDNRFLMCQVEVVGVPATTHVQMFESKTGKQLWHRQVAQVHQYGFITRDGKCAMTLTSGKNARDKGEMNYWDVASGRFIGKVINHDSGNPILYQSPDLNTIALVKRTHIYIQPTSSLW
jgi:WD40 repeat protein